LQEGYGEEELGGKGMSEETIIIIFSFWIAVSLQLASIVSAIKANTKAVKESDTKCNKSTSWREGIIRDGLGSARAVEVNENHALRVYIDKEDAKWWFKEYAQAVTQGIEDMVLMNGWQEWRIVIAQMIAMIGVWRKRVSIGQHQSHLAMA
jgi:hypothetical protein